MKTLFILFASFFVSSCSVTLSNPKIVVSIQKQEAALVSKNKVIKKYPISSGRNGVGTKPGSGKTPTGLFQIVEKIGEGMGIYTGFKGNCPTKNTNHTDPIISRVLVIDGLEPHNKNTKNRLLKIHGTPFVDKIGSPVSMGCVRFKPDDIANLCQYVSKGTIVEIK